MGYPTKVQKIERKNGNDQWYINFPTAVAQAMDFEKGETVNWHIQDKATLLVRRDEVKPATAEPKKKRPRSSKPS